MTDLPPDPLDDLASAHLDGLTTPEEAARLEADPALAARVASLRRVRDLVGRTEPAAAHERDATVAAVLARVDAGADVTPLRPTARAGGGRAWKVVAAAAAVVALAVLVPLALRDEGSDAEDQSAFQETGADIDAGEPGPLAEDQEAGGVVSSTTDPSHARDGDLGAFASIDELADALGEDDAVGPEAPSAGEYAPPPTTVPPRCDLGGRTTDPITRQASATVGGEPVLVVVHAGGSRLLVLDAGTCAVLADRAR